MQLLVTMALSEPDVIDLEACRFARARLEVIDWESKQRLRGFDYTIRDAHLGEVSLHRFAGGCPFRGLWYQTSWTELLVYDPHGEWKLQRTVSHPSFNDLHGVAVTEDEIVIVNTGLEMLQFLDHDGNIVREVSLGKVPTWQRFRRELDYRKIDSTKPHDVHANHVFQIDGQWWVTRCLLRDAVSVEDPRDRIAIEVGQPHDGIVRGDFVYFTTTNAHLVVADAATRRVVEVIDLNKLNQQGFRIGWCRGLEIDGDYAYIGFTHFRRSKWHGAFDVVKDVAVGRKRKSHIEKVDMKAKVIVDSYDYESDGSNAIFTLMDYRRVMGSGPHAPA